MAGFRALPFRDELASSSIGSPPPAYPGDDQISSTPGKQRSNSQETTLNKFGLCNRSPPTARYITFYVIIYLCPMVLFITRVMLLSRGLQYFFSTVVQRLKMSHFIWNVLHSTAFYFHRGVFDDSVLEGGISQDIWVVCVIPYPAISDALQIQWHLTASIQMTFWYFFVVFKIAIQENIVWGFVAVWHL